MVLQARSQCKTMLVNKAMVRLSEGIMHESRTRLCCWCCLALARGVRRVVMNVLTSTTIFCFRNLEWLRQDLLPRMSPQSDGTFATASVISFQQRGKIPVR